MVDIHDETSPARRSDEDDLARFGYKQELRRTLGVFSSFAVAFSYISPSTGIFAALFPRPDDNRRRLLLELADRRWASSSLP